MTKITILGCGASGGVPTIGNNWGQCDPNEPRNQRGRASILVQSDTGTIVVDTGPDFRYQLNREDVRRVDAVLYTHAHSDHIAGIDEVRSFQRRYKSSIPAYGNKSTMSELQERFAYMFSSDEKGYYPQALESFIFEEKDYGREHVIAGIPFIPFEQDHATCISLGYRFGDVAYSTDMINLSDASIQALQGTKIWIADGAGYYFDKITVHANISRLLELNEKVGAEKVYVTHLSLSMDYKELLDRLPEGFFPCYDGLSFDIP
ncbi:MAG: MBL fold metallo-hydrolase [Rhodospirillales bacterium]|nr:MBL fold metallo-hydrolase [Rhodospirillales bacterium]